MTPHEIETIGKSIYGDYWQKPLSKAIDFNQCHISRVMHGKRNISPKLERAINELKRKGRVK